VVPEVVEEEVPGWPVVPMPEEPVVPGYEEEPVEVDGVEDVDDVLEVSGYVVEVLVPDDVPDGLELVLPEVEGVWLVEPDCEDEVDGVDVLERSVSEVVPLVELLLPPLRVELLPVELPLVLPDPVVGWLWVEVDWACSARVAAINAAVLEVMNFRGIFICDLPEGFLPVLPRVVRCSQAGTPWRQVEIQPSSPLLPLCANFGKTLAARPPTLPMRVDEFGPRNGEHGHVWPKLSFVRSMD
jgi:hypothetical protein